MPAATRPLVPATGEGERLRGGVSVVLCSSCGWSSPRRSSAGGSAALATSIGCQDGDGGMLCAADSAAAAGLGDSSRPRGGGRGVHSRRRGHSRT